MLHIKTLKKLLLILIISITNAKAFAHAVAITMDNPNSYFTPLFTPELRDKKILPILKKNTLKIVLFAQGAEVDDEQGQALLTRWNKAGHIIGNHTYSHFNFNDVSEKEYEQDTLKNEALLKHYPNFKKTFRFPYLKEGNTIAKRDGFRAFLKNHDYEMGSVTIDASDWYISDRLEKRLAQNPNSDRTPYKEFYLQHIWERAEYYDNLAIEVMGRSPTHVLLIHHNLLNALFLDDLIHMFHKKGWEVIDADKAFQDPIYKITPNTLPAGESLIWAMAKETGHYDHKLRYPGEDGSYEEEAMNELGL